MAVSGQPPVQAGASLRAELEWLRQTLLQDIKAQLAQDVQDAKRWQEGQFIKMQQRMDDLSYSSRDNKSRPTSPERTSFDMSPDEHESRATIEQTAEQDASPPGNGGAQLQQPDQASETEPASVEERAWSTSRSSQEADDDEDPAPECSRHRFQGLEYDERATARLLKSLLSMTRNSCVQRICEQIGFVSAKIKKKVSKTTSEIAKQPRMQRLSKASRALYKFISHPVVDCTSSVCIICNAVVVTMHLHNSLTTPVNLIPPEILSIQRIFTYLFAAEVLLRLLGEGPSQFFGRHERAWNLLDALINIVAVLNPVLNLSSAATVTALRLVRCFRCLRLIPPNSCLDELRTVLYMLYYSFSSLIWAAMLVALIVFLFSLILASGIEALVRKWHANSAQDLDIPMLDELYGTLPRIMMTLLQAAFGGQDWGDVLGPLYQVGMPYVIVFLAYQSFMMFSLINIMTGVFVEKTKTAFYLSDKQSALKKTKGLFLRVYEELKKLGKLEYAPATDCVQFSPTGITMILDHRDVKTHFHRMGISPTEARNLAPAMIRGCCNNCGKSGWDIAALEKFVEACLKLRDGTMDAANEMLRDNHRQLINKLDNFYEGLQSNTKWRRHTLSKKSYTNQCNALDTCLSVSHGSNKSQTQRGGGDAQETSSTCESQGCHVSEDEQLDDCSRVKATL